MKLNIRPSPNKLIDGGVGTVIQQHAKYLNFSLTDNPKEADLTVIHALENPETDVDVFHFHGMYPNVVHNDRHELSNRILINNALLARKTIAVADWSAEILRRKLHINPFVIRNGIKYDNYKQAGKKNSYTLWPKTSTEGVCDPEPIKYLSRRGIDTFSIARIPGIPSSGALKHKDYLNILKQSSIYLATTKENNSIATMEAMAMGIPIVGYNIGFNSEWLTNEKGCVLVEFGDLEALFEAIQKVHKKWEKYSIYAREYAKIFEISRSIENTEKIYNDIFKHPQNKRATIVIPCHNYGKYVGEAIESALNQTQKCEVIVVDDNSTDNSEEIIKQYPITYIKNNTCMGVAETRNIGITKALTEFIVCLDADDILKPQFIETHLRAFEDRRTAIVYASVQTFGERDLLWFTHPEAQISEQLAGRNQVPSCCMFRKEYWKRAGGYDKMYTPCEDANLWLRIMQIGGKIKKCSSKPMMYYRMHPNSLSNTLKFPDWHSHHFKNEPLTHCTPHDPETLNVIIKGTENLRATLWSLKGQSFNRWHCVADEYIYPWIHEFILDYPASTLVIESGKILEAGDLQAYMNQKVNFI